MPCSFCNIPGHYVKDCFNPYIDILFEKLACLFIDNFNTEFTNEQNMCIFTIKALRIFSLSELKVVGVQYLSIKSNLNKAIYANLIWRGFKTDENVIRSNSPSIGWNTSPRGINEQVSVKYYISISMNKIECCETQYEECPICYEETKTKNIVTLNCGHNFCGTCIKNTMSAQLNQTSVPSCALCRNKMECFIVNNSDTYNLLTEI